MLSKSLIFKNLESIKKDLIELCSSKLIDIFVMFCVFSFLTVSLMAYCTIFDIDQSEFIYELGGPYLLYLIPITLIFPLSFIVMAFFIEDWKPPFINYFLGFFVITIGIVIIIGLMGTRTFIPSSGYASEHGKLANFISILFKPYYYLVAGTIWNLCYIGDFIRLIFSSLPISKDKYLKLIDSLKTEIKKHKERITPQLDLDFADAISRNDFKRSISLIKEGANIYKEGQGFLSTAIRKTASLRAIKFLIDLGVDVNEVDVLGRTPLHDASIYLYGIKQKKVLLNLISAGAIIDKKDEDGKSAWDFLKEENNYDAIKIITIKNSVEIN